MHEGTAGGGYGFWSGVATGLAVAAVTAVILAIAFPLPPAIPPQIPPEAMRAPASPRAPDGAPEASPPAAALIRIDAPGPLIADRAGAVMPPELPGLSPGTARDVFADQPTGSPSLVPTAD